MMTWYGMWLKRFAIKCSENYRALVVFEQVMECCYVRYFASTFEAQRVAFCTTCHSRSGADKRCCNLANASH